MAGKLGSDGSKCEIDPTTVHTVLQGLQVQTKIINKFFSPAEYIANGNKMDYKVASGFIAPFNVQENMLASIQFLLQKQVVSFWDNTVFQLSSFPQFFSPTEEVWYHPFIKQIIALPYPPGVLDKSSLFEITFRPEPRSPKH